MGGEIPLKYEREARDLDRRVRIKRKRKASIGEGLLGL